MTQNQQSRNHHYIPRFYLERWTGNAGQLYEISWRYEGLVARPTFPKGTGYKPNLNTLPGLPKELQTVLEDSFFMKVDGLAAEALNIFETTFGHDMSMPMRSAWSRLIIGLLRRHPDELAALRKRHEIGIAERYAEIQARYPDFRKEGDPPTWEEAKSLLEETQADERSFGILFQKVVDSSEVGKHINNMVWATIHIPGLIERSFLTSDQPVILSNGIVHSSSHILVPLNPRVLFIAVNDTELLDRVRLIPTIQLIDFVNDSVVRQAKRFVFAHDRSQMQFISKRLRKPSRVVS